MELDRCYWCSVACRSVMSPRLCVARGRCHNVCMEQPYHYRKSYCLRSMLDSIHCLGCASLDLQTRSSEAHLPHQFSSVKAIRACHGVSYCIDTAAQVADFETVSLSLPDSLNLYPLSPWPRGFRLLTARLQYSQVLD